MNLATGFLEEENIREFEFSLPMFELAVIRKKNINYRTVCFLLIKILICGTFQHLTQPNISLYIGFKSLESFHFDIEEEFLRGLEDLEKEKPSETLPDNRERQKSDWMKMPLKAKESNKAKSYFVRVPIINPCFRNTVGNLNLKYSFYFRSLKPQSYWMKRSTMVVFE